MMGGAWSDHLREVVPSMTDADLGQYAVTALQKQLKLTAEPSFIHVEQLTNCIPQYLVGHDNVLNAISQAVRSQNLPLSLVGSSYRGASVHDCIYNARLEMEVITGKDLL